MYNNKFSVGIFSFFLVCALAIFAQSAFKLETVSPANREFFLKHLRKILSSNFGFTLIGAKPLSLEEFQDFELISDYKKKCKLIEYLRIFFEKSTKFSLRVLEDEEGPYEAFLINRQLFTEMHEDPDQDFFFETVKIGKLFGYGEENASYYLRYIILGKFLKKIPFVWMMPMTPHGLDTPLAEKIQKKIINVKIPFKIAQPSRNPHFSSLEEEWKWMVQNKNSIKWVLPPVWIQKPLFVSKKGAETDGLTKKYDDAADELGKILHDDQWLELILEQL